MTTEHMASRTLVKSPPELWAECSEAGSLARHIGEFGEIRITRLEPETSVSWEAEHASGTVEIEPSGWGTRVTLTAQTNASEVIPAPLPVGAPEDSAEMTALQTELAEPPAAQANSAEEENDATVEETHAQPAPAVAADSGPADGRWKRMIARTKRWLVAAGAAPPAVPVATAPAEASTSPEAPDAPPEAMIVPVGPDAAVLDPPADEPELSDTHEPVDKPEPPDDSDQAPSPDPAVVLMAALDSLGQAHHRPFSRA